MSSETTAIRIAHFFLLYFHSPVLFTRQCHSIPCESCRLSKAHRDDRSKAYASCVCRRPQLRLRPTRHGILVIILAIILIIVAKVVIASILPQNKTPSGRKPRGESLIDLFYVGETEGLAQRLQQHRQHWRGRTTVSAVTVTASDKSQSRLFETALLKQLKSAGFQLGNTEVY